LSAVRHGFRRHHRQHPIRFAAVPVEQPLINATLKAPNAQLQSILSVAKAYGVSSLEKISGSGLLGQKSGNAAPTQGQRQQAQPSQNPQQNAVEIMGIFGGKKKQQQKPPPK